MEFTINQIDTDGIRNEEFRGRDYIVAPATLMKAMDLDRGYVPQEQVTKSAPAWNGIPVTLFHPANEHGEKVSANSPNVAEKTWLGYIFNAEPKNDGERLNGEVWVDIENAKEKGGEAEKVYNKLENNEAVSLSTAYFGDRLEPGMYDNEQKEKVIGNLRPDHLALLPGKEGKCSVEDGCMAGAPAANSQGQSLEVTGNLADDSEESDEDQEETNGETMKNEQEHEAIGKALVNSIKKHLHGENNMDRDEMIEVLTNQHGFKQESLEGMGDNCLERTYESFNSEDTQDEEPEDEEPDVSANDDEPDVEPEEGMDKEDIQEIVSNTMREEVGDIVDQKFAENEEEQENKQLIDQILDNSDDYDRETLEDTPKPVLKDIAEEESKPATNFAGSVGAQESRTPDHESIDLPTVGDE